MSIEIKKYISKTLDRVKYVPVFRKDLLYVRLESMKNMDGETLEPIESMVSGLLYNFEMLIRDNERRAKNSGML